jgi:hypothetical protein
MIMKIWIDPAIALGHHTYRIDGWSIALIVSAQVKDMFVQHHVSGVEFDPVT